MFVIGPAAGCGSGQQMLGQDYASPLARAIGAIAAFTDAIEAVARGNDPGIGSRTPQVFAEILEHGGIFRRKGSEIVYGLVRAGGKASGGDVMPQDSAINHLGEEARLRNELAHEMRNVFLAFGRKVFLIASASAKSDDDNFSLLGGDAGSCECAGGRKARGKSAAECSATKGEASGAAQELSPSEAQLASDFLGRG